MIPVSKMAVPESSLESSSRENMNKNRNGGKVRDKKVIVAAQEIKYAKYLAGNEKKARDKALKSLTKWFQQRCTALPFSEADFMLIWKGLFYSMWMSDKPLVQEECAQNISLLIHSLTPDCRMMFFKCALATLGNEWFGIDQLRLDKFLMLVRRLVRQAIVALKQNNWNIKMLKEFQQVLDETVLSVSKKPPLGITMHFTEIYLEELAKVSEGKIHPLLLIEFLVPFAKQLSVSNEPRQISCIVKNIFRLLMRQSDSGLEYLEKFHVWKRMGFPGGNINALQKDEASDDEKISDEEDHNSGDETEMTLDPRAGRVNVDLPQLKFSPKHLVNLLTKYRFAPDSNTKSRKAITRLIKEFTEMTQGQFPLGMKKVEHHKNEGKSTKLKQSVNRLVKFEKKLYEKSSKRKDRDEVSDQSPKPKKQKVLETTKKHNLDAEPEVPAVKKQKLLKPKQKRRVSQDSDKSITVDDIFRNFEASFARNSGTWYVFNGETSGGDTSIDESWVTNEDDAIPEEEPSLETKAKRRKMRKPVKWMHNGSIQLVKESLKSPKRLKTDEAASPKRSEISTSLFAKRLENSFMQSLTEAENTSTIPSTQSPKRSTLTPGSKLTLEIKRQSPKRSENGSIAEAQPDFNPDEVSTPNKTLFPQNDWESPLKDGEVEFFVPSNKYKDKMATLAKQSNRNIADLINTSMIRPKGKNRLSLDPNLVRNPFANNGSPGSAKKVKIDLRLNKSQEIVEHLATIKRSPAIPFDANKKPVKPLLKPNAVASPINPFYKKRLNL